MSIKILEQHDVDELSRIIDKLGDNIHTDFGEVGVSKDKLGNSEILITTVHMSVVTKELQEITVHHPVGSSFNVELLEEIKRTSI